MSRMVLTPKIGDMVIGETKSRRDKAPIGTMYSVNPPHPCRYLWGC